MFDNSKKRYPPSAVASWSELRERFNKAELAKHLGLTQSAVGNWRCVPDKYVESVSSFLRIPVSELRPDLNQGVSDNG